MIIKLNIIRLEDKLNETREEYKIENIKRKRKLMKLSIIIPAHLQTTKAVRHNHIFLMITYYFFFILFYPIRQWTKYRSQPNSSQKCLPNL